MLFVQGINVIYHILFQNTIIQDKEAGMLILHTGAMQAVSSLCQNGLVGRSRRAPFALSVSRLITTEPTQTRTTGNDEVSDRVQIIAIYCCQGRESEGWWRSGNQCSWLRRWERGGPSRYRSKVVKESGASYFPR